MRDAIYFKCGRSRKSSGTVLNQRRLVWAEEYKGTKGGGSKLIYQVSFSSWLVRFEAVFSLLVYALCVYHIPRFRKRLFLVKACALGLGLNKMHGSPKNRQRKRRRG